MSNRYWSKWGDSSSEDGQVAGFTGYSYYIKSEDGSRIVIFTDELDDLIYQLMRLKRKVEND